ncbi:MAG: hypothetical protein QG670_2617 [Thermoproteota archaeon]|nr:hypothetical protein [Thermoproteota archaeon]
MRKLIKLSAIVILLGVCMTSAFAMTLWYGQPINKTITISGSINARELRFESFDDYEYSVEADQFYSHSDCRNDAFIIVIDSTNIREEISNIQMVLTVNITDTTSGIVDVTEQYKNTVVPFISYLEYSTNSLGDVRRIYSWDLAGNDITSNNSSYLYCLYQSDVGWFNFQNINELSPMSWNSPQVVNATRMMFDGSSLPVSENMDSRDIKLANALLISLKIDSSTWLEGNYSISVSANLAEAAKT